MIVEYNELDGVPHGHYYIEQIICFGDFECPYETKVVYHSSDKQELLDLIKEKGWSCAELGLGTKGWEEFFVRFRS